jgi:assimilatory nitrate reductase catalytic subunit
MEKLLPRSGPSLFPFERAESVWNEHRESTRGRDLDITGLSYDKLEQPQLWPFPSGATQGTARLYTDGHFATPDGRARFVAPAWRPTAEQRDAHYPVSLTTGRLRDQWHGMSRTGTLGRLFAHDSEPAVEMHPQELNRRRCNSGDLVRVKSRRGDLVLPLRANTAVPPAQAFIAMHWGAEFMAGQGVNTLTSSAFCPQSKQPELKHSAVRVERAALPWQIVAAVWLPQADALMVREKLRALLAHFAYAVCVPFGREEEGQSGRVGVLFRAAAAQPLIEHLPTIEAAMQLSGQAALRYADGRSGQHRAMRLADDGSLQAFMLAGDASAQAWVLDLLQQAQPAAAFGRALLAASKSPPSPVPPKSPQVCACHDVSEAAIASALQHSDGDAAQLLAQLQARLKCGTECGSCLPAVKTLVQRQLEALAIP